MRLKRPVDPSGSLACPLHHALYGAWSPSRRFAGEVKARPSRSTPPSATVAALGDVVGYAGDDNSRVPRHHGPP